MSEVIAWSAALVAFAWLVDGVLVRRRPRLERSEVKSLKGWSTLWPGVALALFGPICAGALLLKEDDIYLGPASPLLQVLGLLATLAALVVTLRAQVELGESFTPGPETWTEQELRTRGLFALVRHPLYLATLLMWVGMGLGTLSWLLLAVGLVVMVPTFYLLALQEERLLVDRFGQAYRDYQARVPMQFPWPRLRDGGTG